MLTFTPVRRRRARRTLVAAAVAACTLPAVGQAAVVERAADGSLQFRGGGEGDIVSVTNPNGGVEIQDLAGVTTRTSLCAPVSTQRVRCAIGVPLSEVLLGSGNDFIAVAVSNRVLVQGESGNDTFDAAKTPAASRVSFVGGTGQDVVSYSTADRAVNVNPNAFDGRLGLDEDIIFPDVERVVGSRFDDRLTSLNSFGSLSGGQGDDVLIGSLATGAITTFDMGRRADGGDRIVLGSNVSNLDYSQRTQPINAAIGSGGADDGEAGEGDELPLAATGSSLVVIGGAAGDTLRVAPGSRVGVSLHGNGGIDTLEGADGPDFIVGGLDSDTLLGNGGSDFLDARDGFAADVVGCGTEIDSASLDPGDGHSSCENRTVGVLRLAPKTVKATAGEPAHVRLSWRHPVSWRNLRKVELRLTQAGAPVGELTIHARAKRITVDGAVELVRKHTRLTRKGKTVTARLAVRLDASVAGQTLQADVEATDRSGARQLERNAGTVRVAK